MKIKSSLILSLFASCIVMANTMSAIPLLTFDMGTATFTTLSNAPVGTVIPAPNGTASSVATGITVSSLSTGTLSVGSSSVGNPARSLFFSEGATGGDFNGVDEATAVAGNDYLQFTVTPDAGYTVDFSSLAFDFTRGGAQSFTNWFLRTNAASNNYVTTVASGAFGAVTDSVFRNTSGTITDPILQGLTSATSFRLYAYGSTGVTSAKRIDQIVLSGTASVPEPSTYAMFTLGGIALWIRFRRVRA